MHINNGQLLIGLLFYFLTCPTDFKFLSTIARKLQCEWSWYASSQAARSRVQEELKATWAARSPA